MLTSYRIKINILLALFFVSVLVVLIVPSIPQNLNYYNFADQNTLFGIKNFWNVITNLFFIITGVIGITYLCSPQSQSHFYHVWEKIPYFVFFINIILIGFGSTYYHLAPSNHRFFWERLPIAVTFMAFFSAVIMERINRKLGIYLLIPFIVIGIFSVIYWMHTEGIHQGDLRFYGWAQLFPGIGSFLMICLYSTYYSGNRYLFEMFGWFGLAKICELFDHGIYLLSFHVISGHPLKHIFMSFAVYSLLRYLKYRRLINNNAISRANPFGCS